MVGQSIVQFEKVLRLQAANAGVSDAFVTKLSPTGSALVYSTYLGGSGNDGAAGIALDSARNAYVTGNTFSTNFPTKNPLQAANAGGYDAFVAKIGPRDKCDERDIEENCEEEGPR